MQSAGSKVSIAISAALLILLGVLQNPAPTGFETRPSSEVPTYFFAVFALALLLAIAVIPVAFWRLNRAILLAAPAALFNVVPALADQAHLLHSAPTPGPMLAVEILAVIDSLVLVYLGYAGSRRAGSGPANASQRSSIPSAPS